jgi:hypothetical protein
MYVHTYIYVKMGRQMRHFVLRLEHNFHRPAVRSNGTTCSSSRYFLNSNLIFIGLILDIQIG